MELTNTTINANFKEEVISVRIIEADFYLTQPKTRWDPVYSEFRGSPVKIVPIIRIFGSDKIGDNFCVHVHGVLPYFYVPYESGNLGEFKQVAYQIANSIDHALNISFGKMSSQTKYVFQIQLVKGIPMYGYHSKQHLFMKIFLYNPKHVKLVSDLFQNGVIGGIRGRILQPHETHIPFVMQFFMDYNLCGMGYLHVPKEVVKYRREGVENEMNTQMNDEDCLQKMSISKYEIDVTASFILNRIALLNKDSGNTNPGIESIWQDERARRQAMLSNSSDQTLLNLDVPVSQERPDAKITEREKLYKDKLLEVLLTKAVSAIDENKPDKVPEEITDERSKLLMSSVYPEECSPESDIANASMIPDHLFSLCESSITEDLTLNLSQNETFGEDLGLIEILSNLEKETNEELNSCAVDLDSTLAPLSQPDIENAYGDKGDNDGSDFSGSDDDEKIYSECTLTPKDLELLEIYQNEDENSLIVPQLDGGNDRSQKSSAPRKKISKKITNNRRSSSRHISRSLVQQALAKKIRKKCYIKLAKLGDTVLNKYLQVSAGNKTSEEFDKRNNLIPIAGSSHDSHLKHLQRPYIPNQGLSRNSISHTSTSSTQQLPQDEQEANASFFGNTINSFNEDFDSFSFISDVSEGLMNSSMDKTALNVNEKQKKRVFSMALTEKPPTNEETLAFDTEFKAPEMLYKDPFYSNANDVTGKMEIGNKILHIKGGTLDDSEEFFIYDGDSNDLTIKQRKPLNKTENSENLKTDKTGELPCLEKNFIITPLELPPSKENLIIMKDDVCSNKSTPTELCEKNDEPSTNLKTSNEIKKTKNVQEISNDSKSSGSRNMRNPLECNKSIGLSQVTFDNTFDFKFNLDNLQNAKVYVEPNLMTILSLEIFVPTRDDLKPNPEFDLIQGIFYGIISNIPVDTEDINSEMIVGAIIIGSPQQELNNSCESITYVTNEMEIFEKLFELCKSWDPDIFTGYEIEMSSWGYVIERGKYLNMNMKKLLSRVPNQESHSDRIDVFDNEKEHLSDHDVETKLTGRILLNLWRLMRSEITLTSYTFENVVYHILHKRLPLHSYSDLTKWFISPFLKYVVLEYYFERVKGNLQLIDQLDLIGRTSEMAKLIGIQFFEVLSRGSQYRVESMMLRIAKSKNYVPLSPSVQQRANMKAPEFIPLILEPTSAFYKDPIVVLDFQSLYPSVIIAHNYCFSTCLGKMTKLGSVEPFEFGASQLKVSPETVKYLYINDLLNISPNGVVFVKPKVFKGILPTMLEEILNTRLMVKRSMELYQNNPTIKRVLNSRQLALKLMANVTYGYTAANFSGRMPCVEVGDSVVSKGREILQSAISLVEENEKKWEAKTIYGDTDSLFVLMPGKSRKTAFEIGQQIAEAVTKIHPQPIKLKLEKIYHPSILQTKKRYVGYKYESPDQTTPSYEAKGIETVRRDGCPAVAKILEKSLRILFDTKNMSYVKIYVCRQFQKILSGRINNQDLIFAKEFRGLNGYKPGAHVPALELTKKWLQKDPRSEPRRGERVPFIIVNGAPNIPLIRLVRSPHEILTDNGLKINAVYYITKAITPPLNRCFLLIGADVHQWFSGIPRQTIVQSLLSNTNENNKKSTISQYFLSNKCAAVCDRLTKDGICGECRNNPESLRKLKTKIAKIDRDYALTKMVCQTCCKRSDNIDCQSLDCPILFDLNEKQKANESIGYYEHLINLNF